LRRAAIDLDCPREKIELIEVDAPLDKPLMSGGTLVAASGCKRKGVYVPTDRGTWIRQVSSVSRGLVPIRPVRGHARRARDGCRSGCSGGAGDGAQR